MPRTARSPAAPPPRKRKAAPARTVYSHSGDIGDLLAALPIVRALGGGELALFPSAATGHRMTPQRAENLRGFLLLQPYISGVRWVPSPVGVNLDDWRNRYQHHLNLSDMVAERFGVPHSPRDLPWLRIDRPNRVARVLFARSPRYHTPGVDWPGIYAEHGRDAVFVGTPDEHRDFQREVGPVSYHYTPDYLSLARAVAGADLVCVNQTSVRWLAEGYKVPVLMESRADINNSHFFRAGAYYLYGPGDFPRAADVDAIAVRSVVERAAGRTLLSPDRLEVIARLVREVRLLPGAMAELGCFRGGSAAVIAGCCPEKPLHLFDTFKGIPQDDRMTGGHRKGDFAADEADVREFLALCDARYHVGTFPRTAAADDARYCFVHLDADTYQSTQAGLDHFVPRMVEGGVIVLDDYDWPACPGVRRAVEEAGLAVRSSAPQQAWWRK